MLSLHPVHHGVDGVAPGDLNLNESSCLETTVDQERLRTVAYLSACVVAAKYNNHGLPRRARHWKPACDSHCEKQRSKDSTFQLSRLWEGFPLYGVVTSWLEIPGCCYQSYLHYRDNVGGGY